MENPILNRKKWSKPGYPPGKTRKSHFFRKNDPIFGLFGPRPFQVYCVQKRSHFGRKITDFHRFSMKNTMFLTPKTLSGGWFTRSWQSFSDPVPLYIKKGPPLEPRVLGHDSPHFIDFWPPKHPHFRPTFREIREPRRSKPGTIALRRNNKNK